MRKVILDTNLLVDYTMGMEPGCSHCKSIINYAADNKIAAYVALHSLKDAHFIIQIRLKQLECEESGDVTEEAARAIKEVAWASTRQLGEQLIIISEGRNEHEHSFVYRALHNEYEDNLVLSAAYAAKVDLLVTNDKEFKSHSPLAALTSEEAVALFDAEFSSDTKLKGRNG